MLTNANLTGANLANAQLTFSTLRGANLSSSTLIYADLMGANLANVKLSRSILTSANLTGADLTNVQLDGSILTIADLTAANLVGANLSGSVLTSVNLTGANLQNAYLEGSVSLSSAIFDSATYNQWTVFPEEFDPVATGLNLLISPAGDLDADGVLNAADVDMLASKIGGRDIRTWWLPDAAFDLNGSGAINLDDHRTWIKDLKHTWYGDADLNGEFNSNDFVRAFQTGKYETTESAGWSEGDWNGDGIFDSADFVTAFQDGGYEQGPRPDAAVVPEPGGWSLFVMGLPSWRFVRRSRRSV